MSGGGEMSGSEVYPGVSSRIRDPPIRPVEKFTLLPGGPTLLPKYEARQAAVAPFLPQQPIVRGANKAATILKFGKWAGRWAPFGYVGFCFMAWPALNDHGKARITMGVLGKWAEE